MGVYYSKVTSDYRTMCMKCNESWITNNIDYHCTFCHYTYNSKYLYDEHDCVMYINN